MSRRFIILAAIGFLLGSFLVFGTSLRHGFSMLDDPYLVVNNLFVRGVTLENLRYVFTHFDPELYMPLTFLSYQLNVAVAGLAPWIFHATNIVLHGINAFLVMILLRMMMRNRLAAFIGGLLFLVHPLNTEAVVWVAGRKDLLSTGFALGSTIAFLKSRRQAGSRQQAAGSNASKELQAASCKLLARRPWYWLSLVLFLLALLSKAMVLTLPVVLLLIVLVLREKNAKRPANDEQFQHDPLLTTLYSLVPFLLFSLLFAIIALIGKERVVQSSTIAETILMAGKSTVFYFQKLVWPTGLTPLYPYHNPIVITSPDFFLPLIVLVIIGALAIVSLRWTCWIFTGLAFFLITLSPTFLNFHKGSVTFFAVDRYAYLPMIGIIIVVAVAIRTLTSKWQPVSEKSERTNHLSPFTSHLSLLTLVSACIILTILCILSFRQTQTWATDERLLTRSLLLYPDSIPARVSLSVLYRESGRTSDERSVLEGGLTFRDAVAYRTGLGSIDAREGKTDAARSEYEKGIKLDPKNPEPLFFLGALEEQLHHPEKALEDYRSAIALDASYVAAEINAGAILLDRGDLKAAEQMFRSAVVWNPNAWEAEYNLFDTLARQDRADAGFPYLERAERMNPDDPDIGLAYAYQANERGDQPGAKRVLHHLLTIDPQNRAAARMLQSVEH